MIIGLLLIALACLVLGLATQIAVWLVASLIATAGAGFLLYRLRNDIAQPKRLPPAEGVLSDADAKAAVRQRAAAESGKTAGNEAADDAPAEADLEAEPLGDTADGDDEVWVIDGRPRYHLGDCAIIKGQDAEPIPSEQAAEDGFMPCSLCEPHAASLRRGSTQP